jgi:hypothetical protein
MVRITIAPVSLAAALPGTGSKAAVVAPPINRTASRRVMGDDLSFMLGNACRFVSDS